MVHAFLRAADLCVLALELLERLLCAVQRLLHAGHCSLGSAERCLSAFQLLSTDNGNMRLSDQALD